ncbi:MAG: YdhR family protein [Rubritepida sp.]|nr:YdhR family protein [Rubritepida sp.]
MKPALLDSAERPVLVVMNFLADAARAPGLRVMAESIAAKPGLIGKIDPEAPRAGSIYLFASRPQARAYHAMHAARLAKVGAGPIRAAYPPSTRR